MILAWGRNNLFPVKYSAWSHRLLLNTYWATPSTLSKISMVRTYLIGPYNAGPYSVLFWQAAVIRAGVKRAGVKKAVF